MRHTPLPPSRRRGVMLLIVTLVLTALALSGAALLTLMKTENEATATRGRKELTTGVVRSAVVYLIGCVEQTEEERERNGGLYNNDEYFCAKPLLTKEEGGADTSRFTILSPKLEDSKIDGIRYGLVDESTRLHAANRHARAHRAHAQRRGAPHADEDGKRSDVDART